MNLTYLKEAQREKDHCKDLEVKMIWTGKKQRMIQYGRSRGWKDQTLSQYHTIQASWISNLISHI